MLTYVNSSVKKNAVVIPVFSYVIPAQAGIQVPHVIPVKTGIHPYFVIPVKFFLNQEYQVLKMELKVTFFIYIKFFTIKLRQVNTLYC